jgi:hypothetical protein
MEKILLSSLVGVVTYFVLSAGMQFSDSKISSIQLKGGNEKEENSKTSCDIFPECFIISENAKKIFEHLIEMKKCGTQAYDDLGIFYSKMFCFEIALGNNPNHPDHVETEKVKQLLENYNNLYGVKTVLHENNTVTYPRAPTFVNSFIDDIDIRAKELLRKLNANDTSFALHEELITKHRGNIQKLYDILNI